MSIAMNEYCVVCGDEKIRHETKRMDFDLRGETIQIDVPAKVCSACGSVEYEDGVDPAGIAFASYRRQKGLLTPQEIKDIRKRYQLSQKSLAAMLGMSEATINRYEGGGLQNEANDQALRSCSSPEGMRDLLSRRGDRLSDWQRRRIEETLSGETRHTEGSSFGAMVLWTMPTELSLTTGFRRFEYERYVAVVIWLCRNLKKVTATSLNKYLFYADFLHYRSESVSLTGAAYRRLQYGPVPADFGGLREQMELDQYVEVREVRYQNENVGEEYFVGLNADKLELQLTPRERKTLETVAHTLGSLTPSSISARSHGEAAWRETKDRSLISYDKANDLSLNAPD